MNDRTWRVLVADDHPVFRSGLRAIVDASEDMTVVAEAVNGAEAVELASVHRPDLILMDLHMPVLGGIEATRKILSQLPDVRVLVLTMIERDDAVMAAMRAGARGYLVKGSDGTRSCAGSVPWPREMRSSRRESPIAWLCCLRTSRWHPVPSPT